MDSTGQELTAFITKKEFSKNSGGKMSISYGILGYVVP